MICLDVLNQLTAIPAAANAFAMDLSNVGGGKTQGGQGLLTSASETALVTGSFPGQKVIGRFNNIDSVTRTLELLWRASSTGTSYRIGKVVSVPAGGRLELTTDGALKVYDASGAVLQSGSATFTTGDFSGAITGGTTLAITGLTTLTGGAATGAKIYPSSDDGAALGDATHNFSDLFLASGAVLNFANSNVVVTHSSAILTVGTGDLRVTTAGTNTASVVTVGGTQTLAAKTLTTPVIGAATGTSLALSGALTSASPSAGLGYAAGAGAVVAQGTDRSTTVVINAICGKITTQATSLAAGASASFTVTNSSVAVGDVVLLSVRSGPTAITSVFSVAAVAAGSFVIKAWNLSAITADTGAAILNFVVLKSVEA